MAERPLFYNRRSAISGNSAAKSAGQPSVLPIRWSKWGSRDKFSLLQIKFWYSKKYKLAIMRVLVAVFICCDKLVHYQAGSWDNLNWKCSSFDFHFSQHVSQTFLEVKFPLKWVIPAPTSLQLTGLLLDCSFKLDFRTLDQDSGLLCSSPFSRRETELLEESACVCLGQTHQINTAVTASGCARPVRCESVCFILGTTTKNKSCESAAIHPHSLK